MRHTWPKFLHAQAPPYHSTIWHIFLLTFNNKDIIQSRCYKETRYQVWDNINRSIASATNFTDNSHTKMAGMFFCLVCLCTLSHTHCHIHNSKFKPNCQLGTSVLYCMFDPLQLFPAFSSFFPYSFVCFLFCLLFSFSFLFCSLSSSASFSWLAQLSSSKSFHFCNLKHIIICNAHCSFVRANCFLLVGLAYDSGRTRTSGISNLPPRWLVMMMFQLMK